jgi:acetyl-CoA acetyltransferase
MGRSVYVIGVGMTKFEKPGRRENWNYPQMAKEAGTRALEDAGIAYERIEQVVAGYCYGDSTSGERAAYELGLTGVPIYNVNNNCSTGSTALFLAKQLVEGGLADCVMALGFEKMERGSLKQNFPDHTPPIDKHMLRMMELREFEPTIPAPQVFGNAGRDHMERFGSTPEHFAKIAWKNHKHSVNNPYSQFQDEYSLADILAAPLIYAPLTKLQCCPTSDGAGCAILASADFIRRHGLQAKAIEIAGMAMATDGPDSFERDCRYVAGYGLSQRAAATALAQAGASADDVDVVELHDCFSANELVTYEALGLCPEGSAAEHIDRDAFTYGGKMVVNPSGGLISKGHPLGATGLAQCAELNWQLRGEAEKRQVSGAALALQHNLGLGGAAVVSVYRRAEL